MPIGNEGVHGQRQPDMGRDKGRAQIERPLKVGGGFFCLPPQIQRQAEVALRLREVRIELNRLVDKLRSRRPGLPFL